MSENKKESQPNLQNSTELKVNYIGLSMVKDFTHEFVKDGQYTHALNLEKNSNDLNAGFGESSNGNSLCLSLKTGYQLIGNTSLKNGDHILFSTTNFESEIGLFTPSTCNYKTLYNSPCLNFKTTHLITAVSKENFDGSESVYWVDNLNDNRYLNLEKIPNNNDCEKLLLSPNLEIPILDINLDNSSGSLLNGSYQIFIAYSINGQRVTNLLNSSTQQQIFNHNQIGGSINININKVDTDFEEYIIYVLVTKDLTPTLYKYGVFSIDQKKIVINNLNNSIVENNSILNQEIFNYNKAESLFTINNHLAFLHPSTEPELNYQLDALKIKTKWVAYRVPKNYYRKGGNKVGYMRDEVYAYGIQWFNSKSGIWSSTYHIPGREATKQDIELVYNDDAYENYEKKCVIKGSTPKWKIYNTAKGSVTPKTGNDCEEFSIGSGIMGYYESEQLYPDNPELFGNLANKPIRHHRMPDDSFVNRYYKNDPEGIILLGVNFENIQHPKKPDGTIDKNYTAYRILRSDRRGNESIIGKGLLFNMREYEDNSTSNKKTILYQNYPYNDLRKDNFISKKPTYKDKDFEPLVDYKKDIFSFHSPSLHFYNPLLGTELKIEGEEVGNVNTYFSDVYNHPKNHLITNFSVILATLMGIGYGYLSIQDKTVITETFKSENSGDLPSGQATQAVGGGAFKLLVQSFIEKLDKLSIFNPGTKELADTAKKALGLAGVVPGVSTSTSIEKEKTIMSEIPFVLKVLYNSVIFSYYFQQGFNDALKFIYEFSKNEQYAKQINSYCFYNTFKKTKEGNKRRFITNANYLKGVVQQYGNYEVNNFNRESCVILSLGKAINDPSTKDNSRFTFKESKIKNLEDTKTSTASSFYCSMKRSNPSQYGLINEILYIPINTVINNLKGGTYVSPILFGGDTYLNRFTLKRKKSFFTTTLLTDTTSEIELNYLKYRNIGYPRFWMNSERFDITQFVKLDFKKEDGNNLPSSLYNLDTNKEVSNKGLKAAFIKRNSYFYLFNNSIIDYYVESEYNIDNRDWNDNLAERHYDYENFTDLNKLFRHDIINIDNFYLYDKSYLYDKHSKILFPQSSYYNPDKAYNNYTYFKNRVVWTLPERKDKIKDSWMQVLPGNYYDFPSSVGKIVGVKSLSRTNILFLSSRGAPSMHMGVDELQTDGDIKILLGDGGLFAREPQSLFRTDYSYGATNISVIKNTQYGTIFISDRQGKIFLLSNNQPEEISAYGMRSWFSKYLPLKLLEDFSNYPYINNTVNGIGFTISYSSALDLIYISKKDYKLKSDYKGAVYNESKNNFIFNNKTFNLGNPLYFDNVSWTISYSPTEKGWLSFHSWIPDYIIDTSSNVLSIKNNESNTSTFWKHGSLQQCNYYGTQYPFIIETILKKDSTINTIKSIEYYLEAYKYTENTKFLLLDKNFEYAMIYNNEQNTGWLKLNLANKNSLKSRFLYPKINLSHIDIEYHKEEQKYRFNQFWDCTKDRGEFSGAQIPMFIYHNNGVDYNLNNDYINYNKKIYERTKIRNNFNKILFKESFEKDNYKIKIKNIISYNNISSR